MLVRPLGGTCLIPCMIPATVFINSCATGLHGMAWHGMADHAGWVAYFPVIPASEQTHVVHHGDAGGEELDGPAHEVQTCVAPRG